MAVRRALVLAALPLALSLTACGSTDPDEVGRSDGYVVRAVDGECELSQEELPAGKVTFEVHNLGTKVSGFTIYPKGSDKPLEEKPPLPVIDGRNVKDVEVELDEGTYEVSCEPHEEQGPLTEITVTADGPAPSSETPHSTETPASSETPSAGHEPSPAATAGHS